MVSSTWECPACTWPNDHPDECIMCRSARPPSLVVGRRRLAAAATESTARDDNVNNDVCREDNAMNSIEPPPNHNGDDATNNHDISRRQRQILLSELLGDESDYNELARPSITIGNDVDLKTTAKRLSSLHPTNMIEHPKNNNQKQKSWDAYASLEMNYQSSDNDDDDDDDTDDEDESSSSREHDDTNDNNDCDNDGGKQWNAFKSFKTNYRNSTSSDEDDEDEEELTKDDNCIDVKNRKVRREYVDLVDTDNDDDGSDDEELVVRAPQRSKGTTIDVECLDVDRDMILPATAKRHRQQTQTSRVERGYSPPIAAAFKMNKMVDDIESDSSLSEVDEVGGSSIRRCSNHRKRQCKIAPSRSSLSIHPTPPWHQSRTSSQTKSTQHIRTTTQENDDVVIVGGRPYVALSTNRNDIIGGSGAGVNGHRLFSQSSSTSSTKPTKTKTVAAKTKKATTTKSKKKKAPTKRRKGSGSGGYKRKSNKRSTSTKARAGGIGGGGAAAAMSNSRAWSARERGIRPSGVGGRGGSGVTAAPYMSIAKQEPLLRNVGGASIQF